MERVKNINNLSEAQIAWFSGWLCADGSIKIEKNSVPAIVFKLTDKDPLLKFEKMFGVSVVGPLAPSGLGKKECYEWKIKGLIVCDILKRCKSWLSDRYLIKAEKALQYQPSNREFKLTKKQVMEIKDRLQNYKRGDIKKLASEFNVSEGLICSIRKGRIWSDEMLNRRAS